MKIGKKEKVKKLEVARYEKREINIPAYQKDVK